MSSISSLQTMASSPSGASKFVTPAPVRVPGEVADDAMAIQFAYQLDPEDLLLEMFKSVGSNCLQCSSEVEKPSDMVLCQACSNFTCIKCFLKGCDCSKKTTKPSSAHTTNTGIVELGKGCGTREIVVDLNEYDTTCILTGQVRLDGQAFEMEIHFKIPLAG